jgi:imidazolonepropionase-like amidohydrolase
MIMSEHPRSPHDTSQRAMSSAKLAVSAKSNGSSNAESLVTTYADNPPSATSTEPPSARRVRTGWIADPRPRVRAPYKAIQCGALLDVGAQRVRRNVTIVTNGERIAEIRDGLVRPENVDAVIDLHDQVCAPGLMDMHVHLASQFPRTAELETPRDPLHHAVYQTAQSGSFARDLLLSGVTTVRSPGELFLNAGSVYMRDAIDRWEMLGPRIFTATRMLASDYCRELVVAAGDLYYERRPPGRFPFESWRPGEDVRAAVRNALALGEDWVKLSVDVGGDFSPGMPYHRVFTLEQMRDAADEAHRLGARITGHIETDEATRDAVLAGLDSIEHAYVLSRETAQLMKERNVYWSTTLVDFTGIYDPADARLGGAAAPPTNVTNDWMKRRDESFRYAYSIGVPMVFATDWQLGYVGATRGRTVLELSEYLALGVTPWDLLKFATLNPAAMLGESENLGSIDPGKYADLIAFPRNPLDDVRAYNEVNFVMKGGNVVRDDQHRSPLPDVFVMQLPDVTYVVRDPSEPFTKENVTCTGSDC